MQTPTTMQMPTAYKEGYEKARAVDPEMAARYVTHTVIEDPIADAAIDELADVSPHEVGGFIKAGIDGTDNGALRDAPPLLQKFFEDATTLPDWLDLEAFTPGVRMFHKNTRLVLAGMAGGVLVEGFTTNIAKSFFITGRLRDQGVRRLQQNNRHMVEIFIPGGLERYGDGWKLSVRIRLIHAQVRRLLNNSEEWDTASWGVPLSAAHTGFALTAFSARLLHHMRQLGGRFSDEEAESFMAVWRYSGLLMGIPEGILMHDRADALRLYEIGLMCEPELDIESIVIAHNLVNSSPLVVGITQPDERRALAKYIYSVSRAMIGNTMADKLNYPRDRGFNVAALARLRLQAQYNRAMDRYFPKHVRSNNYTNFTSILDASVYDEGGITYRMPAHVYAEESGKW